MTSLLKIFLSDTDQKVKLLPLLNKYSFSADYVEEWGRERVTCEKPWHLFKKKKRWCWKDWGKIGTAAACFSNERMVHNKTGMGRVKRTHPLRALGHGKGLWSFPGSSGKSLKSFRRETWLDQTCVSFMSFLLLFLIMTLT